jgi:hypothetical protein
LKQKCKQLVPKHDDEKDPSLEEIEASIVHGVRYKKPYVEKGHVDSLSSFPLKGLPEHDQEKSSNIV